MSWFRHEKTTSQKIRKQAINVAESLAVAGAVVGGIAAIITHTGTIANAISKGLNNLKAKINASRKEAKAVAANKKTLKGVETGATA